MRQDRRRQVRNTTVGLQVVDIRRGPETMQSDHTTKGEGIKGKEVTDNDATMRPQGEWGTKRKKRPGEKGVVKNQGDIPS